MHTSETLAAISPALVGAISKIEGAVKDKKNDHFKNRYATLEACIEASRDTLAEHGLCIVQGPGEMTGNLLTVTTRLVHTSGEWMQTDYQIPLTKSDAQASGSAISYARRYALQAMLNMASVDDDGNAASQPAGEKPPLAKRDFGPSGMGEDFPGAEGVKGKTSHAAKKDGTAERFQIIMDELWGCESLASCTAWQNARADEIKAMPEAWRKELRQALETQKDACRKQMAADEETFPGDLPGGVAGADRQLADAH